MFNVDLTCTAIAIRPCSKYIRNAIFNLRVGETFLFNFTRRIVFGARAPTYGRTMRAKWKILRETDGEQFCNFEESS
jgi:hypothetical protein